jgi:hypothetical protein
MKIVSVNSKEVEVYKNCPIFFVETVSEVNVHPASVKASPDSKYWHKKERNSKGYQYQYNNKTVKVGYFNSLEEVKYLIDNRRG